MIKMFMKKKGQKGFTLIELIVVIAILGILAAIAIPRLAGFRQQSATAADRSTAAIITKAAEAYAAGQNMTVAQRNALTIATLTGAGVNMLNATEIVPQSTGVTFSLGYSDTDGIFYVTNGAAGAVIYPTNVTAD